MGLLTSADDPNFDSALGGARNGGHKIWGSRYYNVFILRPLQHSQEIFIKVLILC